MNSNNQNKFAFTAKGIDGKVLSGFVNAATKEYATKMLMEKDMEVISILSEKEVAAKNNFVQKENRQPVAWATGWRFSQTSGSGSLPMPPNSTRQRARLSARLNSRRRR